MKHTVYAEIFVVFKFSWVPSTTHENFATTNNYLPPLRAVLINCHERSSALLRKPAFFQQQFPICRCKRGIHARIAFSWTQEPSFHRANCQGGKIFVGGFNHENLTPRKFNSRNIWPTKISAYTVHGYYTQFCCCIIIVIIIIIQVLYIASYVNF